MTLYEFLRNAEKEGLKVSCNDGYPVATPFSQDYGATISAQVGWNLFLAKLDGKAYRDGVLIGEGTRGLLYGNEFRFVAVQTGEEFVISAK